MQTSSIPREPGIYAWTNSKNGHQYIGRTTNLWWRRISHITAMRRQESNCRRLQLAWNKHGEAAFEFSILEFVTDLSQIKAREQHYIDTLLPVYNIRKDVIDNAHVRWTPEQREKALATMRSPEYRAQCSQRATGRRYLNRKSRGPIEPDVRAKMSASHKQTLREHPELIVRGERHGFVKHPEKAARGKRHAWALYPERVPRGERNGQAKLTAVDVVEIRRLAAQGMTQAAIGARFGIVQTVVSRIVRRKAWAHVPDAPDVSTPLGLKDSHQLRLF